MLYVYCSVPSQGAYELVHSLEARRLRKFDGMDFWQRAKRLKLQEGDIVVCWGRPIPALEGVRVLNAGSYSDKLKDSTTLANAGIRVVPFTVKKTGAYNIGRLKNHQGGRDLLNPPANPDYYTSKLPFSKEYRIHSFDGRCIRAGEKVPREGFRIADSEEEWQLNQKIGSPRNLAHPWVRSFDGGWRINYDGFKSTSKLRNPAHEAVRTLGLTFGAVDIGLREDIIHHYVIEVNRAPGIEGGSVANYTRAIQRWVKNEKAEGEAEEDKVELNGFGELKFGGIQLKPFDMAVPIAKAMYNLAAEPIKLGDNYEPPINLERVAKVINPGKWVPNAELRRLDLIAQEQRGLAPKKKLGKRWIKKMDGNYIQIIDENQDPR